MNEDSASISASYHVPQIISQSSKPFSDGEFVKQCLSKVVDCICPDKKYLFEAVSLSASTVTRRIEEMSDNLRSQLLNVEDKFECFSIALDESCDVSDTSQLLIFIRGIYKNFEITEELATLHSLKGTTTGLDVFEKLHEHYYRTI